MLNLHRPATVLVFAAVLCGGPSAPSGRPIYVLPLGDSITQGGRTDRQEYSYRYPLFGMLRDAGVEFDFIGSLKTGLHPDATWPDHDGRPFDRDHEGHYGWRTARVRDELPKWLAIYPAPPDLALIHLGTNDQRIRGSATRPVTDAEAADRYDRAIVRPLRDIVATLRQANPDVVVLIGHLNFNEGAATRIRGQVEALARELDSDRSPVVTVHHYDGFNADPTHGQADTFDGAHPNPQGQAKMARRWFEAARPFLPALRRAAGQGEPAATPP